MLLLHLKYKLSKQESCFLMYTSSLPQSKALVPFQSYSLEDTGWDRSPNLPLVSRHPLTLPGLR